MTDDLLKRMADLDPILETDFDTQLDVERDPYGARQAIEMALSLLRDQADRIEQLTAERDRLLKALTFYADEENYRGYIATDPCGCCSSWYEPKIHIDGEDSGNIARAALKGDSHE